MTTHLPYFDYGSNLDLDDLEKWRKNKARQFQEFFMKPCLTDLIHLI